MLVMKKEIAQIHRLMSVVQMKIADSITSILSSAVQVDDLNVLFRILCRFAEIIMNTTSQRHMFAHNIMVSSIL